MRNGTKAASWAGVVLASVGMHAVAFGGLGRRHWGGENAQRKRRPATVEMTVAPPKAAPPPATDAPRAQKPRLAMARPAASARPAATPPRTAAPPAAAETLADFTGQTLTNDGPGSAWSSAMGNGQRMQGPIGRPARGSPTASSTERPAAPEADRPSSAWAISAHTRGP